MNANKLTINQEMFVTELMVDVRFVTGRSGYPILVTDILNQPDSEIGNIPAGIAVLAGHSVLDQTCMVPNFCVIREKEVCGRMVYSVLYGSTENTTKVIAEVLYLRRYNHESIMAERPHFFLATDLVGWIMTEDLPPKHYHQGF